MHIDRDILKGFRDVLQGSKLDETKPKRRTVPKMTQEELEAKDMHCETCRCPEGAKQINKAEDNDAHCPTCRCDMKTMGESKVNEVTVVKHYLCDECGASHDSTAEAKACEKKCRKESKANEDVAWGDKDKMDAMDKRSDDTEAARKDLIANQGDRLKENPPTQEWDTETLQRDFEVLGFMAPFVVVRRKSDGKKGSLEFTHNPRKYFNFQLDESLQVKEAKDEAKKGTPVIRHGQIRNECWNCGNYSDENAHPLPQEEGQKSYYKCSFCGKIMHK